MAGQGAVRSRKYPVGIAVQAPPGWRPPLPAPPPPRPAASPFRAEVGLILRTMMLSMLVMVCMGVGWFLVARNLALLGAALVLVRVEPRTGFAKEAAPLPAA